MLKPFGGLKKIFSPKNALKPFKAAQNVLKPRNPIKAVGSIFGKKKASPASPAPSAAPTRMRGGMRGGKAMEREM